jgi:hypothetical protein
MYTLVGSVELEDIEVDDMEVDDADTEEDDVDDNEELAAGGTVKSGPVRTHTGNPRDVSSVSSYVPSTSADGAPTAPAPTIKKGAPALEEEADTAVLLLEALMPLRSSHSVCL